ncbi:hypothetical protein [Amycolatopsis orientalis]|uniref:hypothetical protein n=1 Tax=Amycolatopsis orientalis TaxID=31958 RepID=UPI00040985DC|nr:hypothetical protein [Amycolatopsis orientalis]
MQPAPVHPGNIPIVVRPGVCFEVGGHPCITWEWKAAGYECVHGFVMWKSQVRDAYRPDAQQDKPPMTTTDGPGADHAPATPIRTALADQADPLPHRGPDLPAERVVHTAITAGTDAIPAAAALADLRFPDGDFPV